MCVLEIGLFKQLTAFLLLTVKVFSLELPSNRLLSEGDQVAVEIHLDGTCVETTSVRACE